MINIAAVAHTVIVRPFDELMENINTALSEVAFAVASLFLPLLANETSVTLAGDLMIYVLMGSTILNGIVSTVFLILSLVELYRKYCRNYRNKVKDEYAYESELEKKGSTRTAVQRFEPFSMN